ncbi:ATP-binding cassette domain-containing protein [Geitlerinema splendidum]|jgi:phospholipid/cholesterol/gamma-HCH transport system ATP-binding protein|nr:ATP-binding cassette domain-containing protein [Geitlerinema splendidum]
MTNQTPIISIRNLVTELGGKIVHEHLDLDIYQGEIFGIVGGSGAGKSVLMNTILGLITPKEGEITVLNTKIGSLEKITKLHMQSHWGVLFQGGALFSSLTVGENIQIPMKNMENMPDELAREMAFIKLKMVGLKEDDFFKYPAELSGGMVKRAALARALAIDPEILFLDEPTAGLDPIAAADFDDLILTLRDNLNLTVVMVTHDLDSISRLCDRIAVLVDKKAIVGTLKFLLDNNHSWIRAYFHGVRGKTALDGFRE